MSEHEITRRQFVGGSLAASMLIGLPAKSLAQDDDGAKYQLYWGDLHNHNEVGYGKGSLERSIDLARQHLDFFAFTGHAWWHDIPVMPENRHDKWLNGFKVHKDHWPKTRRMIREATTNDFVAFLGYEWHSSRFGDHCMIFREDQPELYLPDHVEKLLDFAEAEGALAVPHHVAYPQGWRGANFSHFRPSVSPIVEIFSEHGCSMNQHSPYPYIRHSMGGRDSANTIERQLAERLRFGFVASSDDHYGYPGAYGMGLLGAWAKQLTPSGLFEAFRARRTYGATGDRIVLDVSLNGRPMGAELPATTDREIDVRVEGQDKVASIELVRSGRVIDRISGEDQATGPLQLPGRAKGRLQYGWGPWAQVNLERVCQWDIAMTLSGGRFHRIWPCFQNCPFNEQQRDRLRVVSPQEVHLQSLTTRVGCYAEDPTKALAFELEGAPDSVLSVRVTKPCEQVVSAKLKDLIHDNVVTFTGEFFSESYILHPLVQPSDYAMTVRFTDRRPATKQADWYYVRVTQRNGHVAWSSPIWVG